VQSILIVGGGFAGVWAALGAASARRELGRGPADLRITLASRDGYLTIRPRLYESNPEGLRVPLDAVLADAGVERVEAEVRHLAALPEQPPRDGRFAAVVVGAGFTGLETSPANCRQLVQRAKQQIASGRPRFAPDPGAAGDLARRFLDACATGDLDGLTSMLAGDAVAWADGGGKFSAARRPVLGADRVARFVSGVVAKWGAAGGVRVAPVNGGLGLLFYAGDRLRGVLTVAAEEGRVRAVFVVMNPDKLGATAG
jgi:hypothetical protein